MKAGAATVGVAMALTVGIAAPAIAAGWGASGAGTPAAAAGSLAAPNSVDSPTQTSGSITVRVVNGPTSGSTPTGYRVDETSPAAVSGVCNITGSTGSCAASGLASSTPYTFAVFSTIGSWSSGTGKSVTASTSAAIAAPSTPDLTAASDSGSSSTDNITKVTTPTFTGSAPANALVKLFAGATQVGSQQLSGGATSWSITSSTLADATYAMTATATVSGSTSPASGQLSVTIDTAAPAAPAASYTDKTGNRTADVISGTAEANSSITITGGSITYSGTADGGGAYSVNVDALNGNSGHQTPYSYSVTATDAAGNVSAATAVAGNDTA